MANDNQGGWVRRDFLRTMAGSVLVTASSRLFGHTHVLRVSAAAPPPQHDRLEPEWYRRKIAQVQAELTSAAWTPCC